ncbi:MAG TPA: glycosyl transferase [Marinobacter adhaerens]|jgi:glycosyltransferase involved in cell wall biosynthesis|uniref:Glycosyl transferase n=1 Tax=Marinobacter adhaerens TaxID=1033846 RepID=A0A359C033_9GAMM|nr:glycosyl transferase [Marinobacter adhaerens]HBX39906.1 glycosyl transferase [Marinobacter adhaerens]
MNTPANPLVSIITPTYNRADFIGQAVNSVLAQTYTNFELLIIDDGSTDHSRDMLQPFLTDSRLRYFHQENQGQSVARNLALSEAKGDFVCFLDSDNYWPAEKLEHQIELFRRHPDYDVIYADIIVIDEKGQEITRKNMRRYSGHIARYMIRDNCVSMNTAMARRRCFDELGVMSGKRRVADDYDLWLRFSARFRFLYVPEFFAYYRVMDDQISSDKTRRFDSNWQIINDFRRKFPDAMSEQEFDSGFAAFHSRKARYLASQGSRREALVEMLKTLRLRPLHRASWRSLAAVLLK